jgi:DnaK suppressor protein
LFGLDLYLHNSLSSDRKSQKSPLIDPFRLINLNLKELVMEQKDIEQFKKTLTNQLQELLIQASDTVSGMTITKENLPDPADRATIETDRNFMLRIRDRERLLAVKISKTILRIENGTFGICDKCEEEIAFKRLEARPVTTQCLDCKTKEETYENARGV